MAQGRNRRRAGAGERRAGALLGRVALVAALLAGAGPSLGAPASPASGGTTYVFDLGAAAPAKGRYVRVDLPANADLAAGKPPGAWLPGAWGLAWEYSTTPESQGYNATWALEFYDVGPATLGDAAAVYVGRLAAGLTSAGWLVQVRPGKLRNGPPRPTPAGPLPTLACDYTFIDKGGDGKSLRTTVHLWKLGDWLLAATAANIEDNEHSSLFLDGIAVGGPPPPRGIRRALRAWGLGDRVRRFVHGMPPWPLSPPGPEGDRVEAFVGGERYAPEPWGDSRVHFHAGTRRPLGDADQDLEAAQVTFSGWLAPALEAPLRKALRDAQVRVVQAEGTSHGRGGLTTIGLVHREDFAYWIVLERETLFPREQAEHDRKQVLSWLESLEWRELRPTP